MERDPERSGEVGCEWVEAGEVGEVVDEEVEAGGRGAGGGCVGGGQCCLRVLKCPFKTRRI